MALPLIYFDYSIDDQRGRLILPRHNDNALVSFGKQEPPKPGPG